MQTAINYGSQPSLRFSGSYVFVVSHMRSFSSLLCHILGSHPDISGYAENHQQYFTRSDLRQLAWKVRTTTEKTDLGRYVLDKILHNQLEIAPDILRRPDVKVIFLVRRAGDTIASILDMSRAMGHAGEFSDPAGALEYYVSRLAKIEAYSELLGRQALLVAAERLIDDTAATLAGISEWLHLDSPLPTTYKTFRHTGERGFGDPSPNIKAGSVVADAALRRGGRAPIAVPADIVARGDMAYATCWDRLAMRCDVR